MLYLRSILLGVLSLITLTVSSLGQDGTLNGSAVPTPVPFESDRYRIGLQDTIEVQVFGQPQLSQRVRVNANGTINLFRLPEPLIAVCKTERELANDIADAYRKDYLRNPEVNVTTVEQFSQSYSVIGAVEKPAAYFITRRLRLLELLAIAGGPSKEAGSGVLVARRANASVCDPRNANDDDDDEGLTLMSYKLRDILENRVDLVMRAGDTVSVLPADVVFVYGNVNKQGQVTMREPITLTQALASAEGLKPATKKDEVRVFRQKPGEAERIEMTFNLKDIDSGKVRDPFLEPNDIVAVSEDKAKSILNAIGRSLTQGVGTIFYRVTP
ncbi:polysaccharide biosynthesis/export family protein [Leptolyngbya sp. 7M]|uniref:polysaccharide biosynthesis/export family protein n=1 Tax=Leptolyngbya sp. 7M TaxID=2812896 RepID=UPI001B8A984B|nr:polysaccharide biosynthesis/export family protein [Leptolyngbya sp. 7M]QYO66514.1 polysaccharide biosynthesis/export family protein [Leptolyngbya sp. 7M]